MMQDENRTEIEMLDRELVTLTRDTGELCAHLEYLAPDALALARLALGRRQQIEGAIEYLTGTMLQTHLGADYVADRLRDPVNGELVSLTHTDGQIKATLIIETTETPENG